MSVVSTGACSRPRRSVRSRSRRLLSSGPPGACGESESSLTCASVVRARATIARSRSRRRVGKRDEDAVDVLADAQPFEVVGRPEHALAAQRASDELFVVVDEADDHAVGVRAPAELECERESFVGRADDERAQTRALAFTLALQREEPRLESDAAASEEYEQRGDRRRAQQRECRAAYVGEPRDFERGDERADDDGRDDAHRFFD